MASLSLLFSLESPSSTSDLKINVGLCLCAVSQNCGLPGLPVPYGATCCLSDHLAIRRLLRREKLNHPRTPREFLLLLKCALAPSCVFPHNLITLSVCNYKLHLPLPPPISLIFLLSSCLVSSPLRLLRQTLLKGTLTAVVKEENSACFIPSLSFSQPVMAFEPVTFQYHIQSCMHMSLKAILKKKKTS